MPRTFDLWPPRIRSNIIMYNAALSACEGAERWEEASKLLQAGRCFGGGNEVEERWGKMTTTMIPSKVHHDGPMKFWAVYIDSDIGFLALVDVRVTFTRKNWFTSFLFLIMCFGYILRRSERDLQCVFTFLWGTTIIGGKTQTGCWLHPAHVKDTNRLRSW